MPAWLTWTIAILAGWSFVALAVTLLVGHVFQRVGAADATLAQIAEEAEQRDWSAAPLTRAVSTETEESLDPVPDNQPGRVP
jgi:Na+/H+-dicarboxylate symporter